MDGDVSRLLAGWAAGDADALGNLMPIVYDELRRTFVAPARARPVASSADRARPRSVVEDRREGSAVVRKPRSILRTGRKGDARCSDIETVATFTSLLENPAAAEGPADIAIDRQRDRLLVPLFRANTLAIVELRTGHR